MPSYAVSVTALALSSRSRKLVHSLSFSVGAASSLWLERPGVCSPAGSFPGNSRGRALLAGTVTTAVRYALIGPAVRFGTLPLSEPLRSGNRRQLAAPAVAGVALLLIVGTGLLRDPFTSAHARLAAPAWSLPFGADASGRDVLARVGHGAVGTLGTALVVVLVCLAVGIAVGLFPLAATGPLEVAKMRRRPSSRGWLLQRLPALRRMVRPSP